MIQKVLIIALLYLAYRWVKKQWPAIQTRGQKPQHHLNLSPEGKLTHPEQVVRQGVWELQLITVNKSTFQEAVHGVLLEDGKVISPKEPGVVIVTDLGLMKYYGDLHQKAKPQDPSGWNFADQTLMIKPGSCT